MSLNLFVVDSSPAIRRLVEHAAKSEGYQVAAFEDGRSALDQAERKRPAIIIADYHLEGLTLSTFCDKLSQLDLIATTTLVLLVNASDHCDETLMRAKGVKAFLNKPLQTDQIIQLIRELRSGHTEPKKVKRRRAWPPETSVTDAEGGSSDDAAAETTEILEFTSPVPDRATGEREDSKAIAAAAAAAAAVTAKSRPVEGNGEQPVEAPSPVAPPPTSEAPPLKFTVGPSEPVPDLTPAGAQEPASHRNIEPEESQMALVTTPTPDAAVEAEPTVKSALDFDQLTWDSSMKQPQSPEPQSGSQSPTPTPMASASSANPVPPAAHSVPPVSSMPSNGFPPHLEQAARGFVSALVEILEQRTDGAVARVVSDVVTQEVAANLSRLVQGEVAAQMAAAIPHEQLVKAAESTVQQELTSLASLVAPCLENTVTQHLTEHTGKIAEESATKLVREMAEQAVQTQLPDLLRQHIGQLDTLVKESLQEAIAQQARDVADTVVRQIAGEKVGALVTSAVPEIAEAHIKKEIERLTSSA